MSGRRALRAWAAAVGTAALALALSWVPLDRLALRGGDGVPERPGMSTPAPVVLEPGARVAPPSGGTLGARSAALVARVAAYGPVLAAAQALAAGAPASLPRGQRLAALGRRQLDGG